MIFSSLYISRSTSSFTMWKMPSSNPIEHNRNNTTSSSNSPRIQRQWSDLNYDLLVSIFSRLNTTDLIIGVSSVCSSWRYAARDGQCWRVLDLSDWDSVIARIHVPVTFNLLIHRVLWLVLECEHIEKVYFPSDANEQDLFLVSKRLPNLIYFSFPRSKIPKLAFYSSLINFKSLKGMAVSYRYFLTDKVLSRCAQYPAVSELKLLGDSPWGNYAAKMICSVFPELRKLDMQEQHFVITKDIFLGLLDSLKQLEYLDISGCSTLMLDERVIKKATSRLKVFIWHGMNF